MVIVRLQLLDGHPAARALYKSSIAQLTFKYPMMLFTFLFVTLVVAGPGHHHHHHGDHNNDHHHIHHPKIIINDADGVSLAKRDFVTTYVNLERT